MLRAPAALVAVAACAGPPAATEPRPSASGSERVVDVTLAGDRYILPGTLELPASTGPVPCAVFFAGSGPTDRDWRSGLGGAPPTGKYLAAALRRRGVGTFRFDKVGSPKNRGAVARLSLDHHRDEGVLAFEFVEDRPDCDRVFLLGNSEGAIHALRTAARKAGDPALGGVIAIDPPDRPLVELLLDQVWAAELAAGADHDALAQLLADFRYAAARGARPPTGGVAALERIAASLRHPENSRVARQLLFADPLRAAAEFSGSVLVLSSGDRAGAAARLMAALGPAVPGAVRRRELISDADSSFVDSASGGGGALSPGVAGAVAAFINASRRR